MRSDVVKKGVPAAPNRSLLYALGYTKEELERPLIGVVCSYNEIVRRPESGPPGELQWSSQPSPCATASPWAMWA